MQLCASTASTTCLNQSRRVTSFSASPRSSSTLSSSRLTKVGFLKAATQLLLISAAAPRVVAFAASPAIQEVDISSTQMEVATLGGGCFWCIEACYNMMKGVQSAVSGYAGGHVKDPTYKQVCNADTGHAEVVQVTFDPKVVSYEEILEVFFTIHDPTTKDRQGNDVGPQYRSIIMYHNEEQKQAAERVMSRVSEEGWFAAPLTTELVPLETFYAAEDHHQEYYKLNPEQGYCRVVVGPKVAKFRAKFGNKLK